jgi:hypothetical protein
MLISARFDEFAAEDKYMSPADASEEAAVAGLLGLKSEEQPADSKQPTKRQSATDTTSKRKFKHLYLAVSLVLNLTHVVEMFACVWG